MLCGRNKNRREHLLRIAHFSLREKYYQAQCKEVKKRLSGRREPDSRDHAPGIREFALRPPDYFCPSKTDAWRHSIVASYE